MPWVAVAGDPAVVIDRPVAQHLEVLRGTTGRCRRGIVETYKFMLTPFDRLLLRRRLHRSGALSHPAGLEQRGGDVDHVVKLGTDASLVLDSLGPGHDHAVASAAEMRGNLLGPLQRAHIGGKVPIPTG